MERTSVMLVSQSTIKTFVIITLVILGLGTTGATIGYATGALMAGLIGTLLMWTSYKILPKPTNNELEIKAYLTVMFKYGLPISISTILNSFFVQFLVFLLPIYYITDNIMIGNYGIASNFVVLIGFFASPIITLLFPAFSKLDPIKDKQTLKNVFQFLSLIHI